MESLLQFIKKYGEGKGEAMMWKSVEIISDEMEKHMDEATRTALMRRLYGEMAGGHYDEAFAKEDVRKMYYIDTDGQKKYAPYWTDEQVREVYNSVKAEVPKAYNFWDFYVALQMVKSDNCPLMRKWFPDATPEDMDKKFVELTLNWLKDDDNPFGSEKVWGYLNR
jgi:hypothetical protein